MAPLVKTRGILAIYFMNIWIWISVGIIVLFVFIFLILSSLKKDYSEDSFIGNTIDTFKNCCRRILGN